MERLRKAIRDIPDFPKPGIIYKDICPLLRDPQLFSLAIDAMCAPVRDWKVTAVVAIESRGFIFGAPMAQKLGVGLVIVRKPNKLPFKKLHVQYALEYGTDTLEVHEDALHKNDRVVVVDDILATGGTAAATGELIGKLGARVAGYSFLAELAFLKGRERLRDYALHAVLSF